MRINHLSLTNFRNFARLDIDIPGGLVLIVGKNAQGKTSLLEAIYYLATFTSFHAVNDREVINFLVPQEELAVSRIKAGFQYISSAETKDRNSGKNQLIEIRIIREINNSNGIVRTRKDIIVDEIRMKVSEALGRFTAVLFTPQMMAVVEGSPEDRRRFLNLTISQVIPNYADQLSDYRHILIQRNALLKQLAESGGEFDQLDYWDELISQVGAKLIFTRIRAIQELERDAARLHKQLTREQEVLRLSYVPSYDPIQEDKLQYALPLETSLDRSMVTLEEIQGGYLAALTKRRRNDIQRGVTTLGPHRDEIRFLGNSIDLGMYGSRGQARTAVMSVKLAEIYWMKKKTTQWPILLLDEVLAELDPNRREDLLTHLKEVEQAIITTTDLDMFPEDFCKNVKIWEINSGRIN